MYSLRQARSRVYFDIEIGQKKEGRVTFELVSTDFIAFQQAFTLKEGRSMMMVSKAQGLDRRNRHSMNYQSYQRQQRIFVRYARGKRAPGNLGNLSATKVCTNLLRINRVSAERGG